MYCNIGSKQNPHLIEVPRMLAAHILKQHGQDQQKRALDQLVDKQYNKIHEDAFAKIVRQRKASKPASERARGIIWSLWQERARFKSIMKTQDFEYAKLLKENEELRAELAALKKTKGDYGQA